MERDRRARAAEADRRRYDRVIDLYLDDCYAGRSVVRISELADRLGGNRQHLARQVERLFGQSLRELLQERQFAYAIHLLKNSILTTSEVAESAGFGHRSTFFRVFKERFGVTPAESAEKLKIATLQRVSESLSCTHSCLT